MTNTTPIIERLTLTGFKTVRQLKELELGPINVLIGPNGAGKSNLISFFRLLSRMATPPGYLQLFIARSGGASTWLYNGSAVTQQITAELSFQGSEGPFRYDIVLSHAAPDTIIFEQERLSGANQQPLLPAATGHRETVLLTASQEPGESQAVADLRKFFADCLVYQFHNTSETARIRQRWSVADNRALKEDGANLAPFLLRIREHHPAHYQRITATLRQIAPYFADFVLEPEGENMLLRWREIGSDILFGPHQASDGTIRAMALIALLMQPTDEMPSVLILDEPELGLHPSAITMLSGLLQSASLHRQVIVATQSPVLLDYFDPEHVIVAERDVSESTFRRLDRYKLEAWLDEYTLGDLWDKNVLGGKP